MIPYLPQYDPKPEDRTSYLKRNRQDYQFNRELLPPLPFLTHVPHREFFSADYVAKRLASMASLPANMLAAKSKNFLDPLDTLEEYDELLTLIPKPNVMKHFRTDASFAEQRLSGCNAIATRQIQELPVDFAIDNDLFQSVVGNDITLDQALKERRLYFLEHPFLDGIKGGISKAGRKYMPKTRSLYYWAGGEQYLVPVSIELKSESGNNRLMYTLKDAPLDWFFAKLCVQVADCNHQELGSHFVYTHAAMGPFAVVTARQLSENHPVSLMLKPHFRFMIFDNDLGRTSFLNPGGPIDHYAAGTLDETLTFIVKTLETWSLDTFDFPSIIKRQNMDDSELLPHYPFRDDGLLVWEAVKNYVTQYLRLYYKSSQDLLDDHELQAWALELAAYDGGRVAGMPDKIETVEQLIDVLSVVIFTCGPLHSVLNFSQYEYMAYVPNMPYAGYQPVPESKGIDMETILSFLPPFQPAAEQVNWTMILTSYHYDKLGHYDEEFVDPLAQEVVLQFQQNLADIERQIQVRNQNRPVPFKYFLPSETINSINT